MASQVNRGVAARSSPLLDEAWGETLAPWFASHGSVRARRATPERPLVGGLLEGVPPTGGSRELKSSGLPEAGGHLGEVRPVVFRGFGYPGQLAGGERRGGPRRLPRQPWVPRVGCAVDDPAFTWRV